LFRKRKGRKEGRSVCIKHILGQVQKKLWQFLDLGWEQSFRRWEYASIFDTGFYAEGFELHVLLFGFRYVNSVGLSVKKIVLKYFFI
jgi:hypothetical protein